MNNIYKKCLLIFSLFLLSFIYYNSFIKADNTLISRLQGKILLQVEENGEAWYVYPLTDERYYLGRPIDAFKLMKNFGLGISNKDINKIAIAEASFSGFDSDGDGLSDLFEDAIGSDKNNIDTDADNFDDKTEIIDGFNPNNLDKLLIDNDFSRKQAGRILIQAEQNGEAWYINPDDNKRYFLGRPEDAFNIMRQTGLGITNADLNKIPVFNPNNNSDTKNTIITNNNKRKYTDPVNGYSFEYPNTWKKTTINGKKEVIFLRNYENDIIKEKKAMITIAFIKTDNDLDLNKFQTASKNGVVKKSSENQKINQYYSLNETFNFSEIDGQETTTFLQLNNKEMLIITLFSAGNHNYYNSILGDLLRSVEYIK